MRRRRRAAWPHGGRRLSRAVTRRRVGEQHGRLRDGRRCGRRRGRLRLRCLDGRLRLRGRRHHGRRHHDRRRRRGQNARPRRAADHRGGGARHRAGRRHAVAGGSARRAARRTQRGGELVGGLVPVRRVLAERPHDDAGESLRDRRLERARVGRRRRDVLHGHGHVRLAAERHPPGEHLVEHHAEAVQVRALVRRPSLGLFRRKVGRRAHHRSGARQRRVTHARDAEVGDDHATAFVEHHVVGGDVAMHDVSRVRGRERREHGERDGDGFVRRERAVPAQSLLE